MEEKKILATGDIIESSESLDMLEARFDNILKEVEKRLEEKSTDGISIHFDLGKVETNQFKLTIPDAKKREDAIYKLEAGEIPFIQKGSQIHTTMSGACLVAGALTPPMQINLREIEKEIQERVHGKFEIETLVRIHKHRDYKWAVEDEKLGNTYYFKSLMECHEALERGVIKSKYEFLNIPQWSLPASLPQHWELPSTMKHLIEPEDKSPTVIIDGGDELAMALSSSGIPDLLAYGIQATLLYPFFLSVLRIGFDGASDEEKEHKELLLENLEEKKELRGMLIESLIRETKIKEELSRRMENLELMEKNSGPYQLISALSKEGAIRETLGTLAAQLSNDNNEVGGSRTIQDKLDLVKLEGNKIQSESNKLISKETLENLSDKKFYKYMVENSHKLSESPEVYRKFIDSISQYKQVSDKTFLRKTQRYIQTQILKKGMGWMWMAMAAFEANAIMNTFGSVGLKNSATEVVGDVLKLGGSGLAVAGQAAMVIYGIAKTGEGMQTVHSLNDWIKKINQSELVDKNSKTLITNYLKSRRTHTILGDCVGSTMLSTGQVMMIMGGPAGGFGTPLTFPGAGLTILGVGITLTNNIIAAKKFHINDEPSKIEREILQDTSSLPKDGLRVGESQYTGNLRWKFDELKSVSAQKESNLLWIDIYSGVIKVCQNRKVPKSEKELQNIINIILKGVKNKYSYKFSENMKSLARKTFEKDENILKIKKIITAFYEDKPAFYHRLLHEEIGAKKDSQMDCTYASSREPAKASAHPKYRETSAIIGELKEGRLWDEARRKVIKRMVINKKSKDNIRGVHFEPYVKAIATGENRYIRILDAKLRIPLLEEKKKTVYVFDEDAFKKDLENYKNLEPFLKRFD